MFGPGRFDADFEVRSIERGMQDDLQNFAGETVSWYAYDATATVEDDVYDVGDITGGRHWKSPASLRVLSAIRTEGSARPDPNGLYTTDRLHLGVSYDEACAAGLDDLVANYRAHLRDRVVWQGVVYTPLSIELRGIVQERYTVVGIDLAQVNPDELISDATFQAFAAP